MRKRITISTTLILLLASVFILSAKQDSNSSNENQSERVSDESLQKEINSNQSSKIQVVFALDATGSMAGLIAAAKDKIWSIAGSLAQTDDSIPIELGLIFYRDKGDAFITKKVPLTANLDDMYKELMEMNASGGGDTPESVNKGLYEAVTQFSWNKDTAVYKAIFLVGDCPPHMDYKDDIKYMESCRLAKKHDIVINTILMGNNDEAKKIWKELSVCNGGSFVQMNMKVNDIEVSSPVDDSIAIISDELDKQRIYYGTATEKTISSEKMNKSEYISTNSSKEVKAKRVSYNISKSGKETYYGKKELVNDYKKGNIKLEQLTENELPAEMKNMTLEQRKKFVDDKLAKRTELEKKLLELDKKRQAYIEKELAKKDSLTVKNSFNNKIYDDIKSQAAKKNIDIKGKVKY
jgi:Mg-chelatase subunit ChlD